MSGSKATPWPGRGNRVTVFDPQRVPQKAFQHRDLLHEKRVGCGAHQVDVDLHHQSEPLVAGVGMDGGGDDLQALDFLDGVHDPPVGRKAVTGRIDAIDLHDVIPGSTFPEPHFRFSPPAAAPAVAFSRGTTIAY